MDAIVARQDNHHKTLQTERLRLTSDCLSIFISLNEFYVCICIIFVLALYSVPPLLLNPALSGYERIKVLAEQTGGAVFSALAGGRYSTSNNVREPL